MDERGKKYLIKEDREFQSDLGIIKKEQMERATIGDTLITHLNKEFRVIKPNVNDFIELMERRCSILVQKDIGNVLAKTGLGAGCRVVDAGTGAGAIALNFANVVGEKGRVFTYEIREDFAEVAQRNIDNFGINNRFDLPGSSKTFRNFRGCLQVIKTRGMAGCLCALHRSG